MLDATVIGFKQFLANHVKSGQYNDHIQGGWVIALLPDNEQQLQDGFQLSLLLPNPTHDTWHQKQPTTQPLQLMLDAIIILNINR